MINEYLSLHRRIIDFQTVTIPAYLAHLSLVRLRKLKITRRGNNGSSISRFFNSSDFCFDGC